MAFVKGPIFANMILADEINRTPPKTQAALLEAMQEHQVTAAGVRYALDEPFFVLATQNPIEMEGTYPLPEAQLDRFMFNVSIDYLPEDDEVAVVRQTTTAEPQADGQGVQRRGPAAVPRRGAPGADRRGRGAVRRAARRRLAAERRTIPWASSTSGSPGAPACGPRSTWCSAPRPGRCSTGGRTSRSTISAPWPIPVLRHRILINYRAEAEGVVVDSVVDRLLKSVKENGSQGERSSGSIPI